MTNTEQATYRTKQTARTWLGIPGTSWEYLPSKYAKRMGRRVTALRWTADNPNTGNVAGDLVLRLCEGDGRTDAFTVLDSVTIPNGTDADADAFATRL